VSAGVTAALRGVLAPALGIALVLVLAAVTTPAFFTVEVARIVLFQIGVIGIAAIGQTIVLLLGGIDLSISAVIALTSVTLAVVTRGQEGMLVPAMLAALGLAVVVGGINASLVILRNVPPFVATFATFVLIQGAIVFWTGGAPSGAIPGGLAWLGKGRIADLIPVALVLFAIIAVAAWIVLARTTTGRRIYATGLNPRAASLAGIRTRRLVAASYIVAALCGALTGFVNAGYIGYVDSALVRELDLNSIAAAVIGGIALTGGRGRIVQTVTGTVLLAVLFTWLVQLGATGGTQLVVTGAVILAAVLLQTVSIPRPRLRRTAPHPE